MGHKKENGRFRHVYYLQVTGHHSLACKGIQTLNTAELKISV
jgi:hypothetical protein